MSSPFETIRHRQVRAAPALMPNSEATATSSPTVRRPRSDPSNADARTERALSGRSPISTLRRDRGTAGTDGNGITKSLTRDNHTVILTDMASPTKSMVADDVEIVRRILAHIDAGTTDEGEAWREPVENYLNPARFGGELRLLRSMPSVFAPSAAIPSPGDHVERDAFGVPLFAVRGRDQRARVFRNACRHRGMALVEGTGCSRALVCRYHGWTYGLNGSLSHVPHADAFPDLDMSTRGLVEVASREVDGLIVIDPLDTPGDHGAMAALTDGSPWRDNLLPAE